MDGPEAFSAGPVSDRYYRLKGKRFSGLQIILSNARLPEELEDYVEVLVNIADVLGIDDLSFSAYSPAISGLSDEELSLERSILRMQYAHEALVAHLASAEHLEQLTSRWIKTLKAGPTGDQSVAALERRKAALIAKAKEYHQQLTAIMSEMPGTPAVPPSGIQNVHKELKAKEQDLREKRARVQAFQGVPPNLELARLELRNARDEQMKLIQLRERLLDNMASGVR